MDLSKNQFQEVMNNFANQMKKPQDRTAIIPLKEYDNYKLIQKEFEKMCDKFNEVEEISRNIIDREDFDFNSTMGKEMYKIYCIMVKG